MKKLNGIKINNNFLQISEEIGILLFQEFSSTKLYFDSQKGLIIREWVDCSDDGLIDRFFFFKTNKFYLSKFFRQEISHKDLINFSTDGLAYFQDISIEGNSDYTVISVSKIEIEYLPSYDSNIEKSDFVDYQEINNLLELENIDTFISISDQVKIIAQNQKTEIYNLHIEKGNGVGHGKIDTRILGKTLLKFDDLYENVSFDIQLGKSRGNITEKGRLQSNFKSLTQSEVIGTIAASFGVLIKPKITNYSFFEDLTSSEIIAQRTFNLINNSLDSQSLVQDYPNYSEYTILAYKNFLKEIYSSGINLELSYYSDNNNLEYNQRFNLNLSNKIIADIESLKNTEEDDFKKVGKFRALNCDTGHFTFISNEGEIFRGYLDKLIVESSTMISFEKIYKISINRKIIKEAGRDEPNITDIIIAYYDYVEGEQI
jgi:hypothetical protein